MLKNRLFKSIITLFVITAVAYGQAQFDPSTVKAGKFDNGKMWTFDFPPVEYLEATYDFAPDEAWFEDVRLSALRIPGCTSSFVSEDGLIMTNHHCAEGLVKRIQKEGEDLAVTGFYASTLEEERKVERYYADQLVFIEDVTEEVVGAFNSVEDDKEKIEKLNAKVKELEDKYKEETGLRCKIYPLFNGGKYSLYGYKRFTDVRVVFIPETKIGYFGGDYDNFTYPRYNLDCAFLRVYDDEGNPVKADNFFKFNPNGAPTDDVVFTVGNPGSTRRLKTVAVLEYYRDVAYRNYAWYLDNYYNKVTELQEKNPERAEELESIKARIGNGQKSISNAHKSLVDPYLIARKAAFENDLKAKVEADENLSDKYGHVWDAIADLMEEKSEIAPKTAAYNSNMFFRTAYFKVAGKLVDLAIAAGENEFNMTEVDSIVNELYSEEIDTYVENAKLGLQLDFIKLNLGDDNSYVETLMGTKSGDAAAEYVLSKSVLGSKDKVLELMKKGPESVLESTDPIINYIASTKEEYGELMELTKEIDETAAVYENLLGQAMHAVFGVSIPPDANFTLRLSDGLLKSFDYNGTKAPVKTTFYGLYDRWNSWEKEYPWELPQSWIDAKDNMDLATPFNFISTNDIVGGNSGSAVIDRNAEVVGLAFDGNILSLKGSFIFMPEENRCVSVSSKGMLTAFEYVYKAENLVKELTTGKRPE